MQIRTVLIEQNPHLRRQLTQAIQRKGLSLAGCYDCVSERLFADLPAIAPDLVIFHLRHGHAGQWRLVRALQSLPESPVLMALASVEAPGFRETARAQGIHYVFDPLLEVDSFLDALHHFCPRLPVAESKAELVR